MNEKTTQLYISWTMYYNEVMRNHMERDSALEQIATQTYKFKFNFKPIFSDAT